MEIKKERIKFGGELDENKRFIDLLVIKCKIRCEFKPKYSNLLVIP